LINSKPDKDLLIKEDSARVPQANQEKGLESLKDELTSIENEWYKIKAEENTEIVLGKKGNYYLVEIKALVEVGRSLFRPARYVAKDFELRFRESLEQFHRNVINRLNGNANYMIFVKGSADKIGTKSLKRFFDQGFYYNEIYYLQKNAKYVLPELQRKQIPQPYRNKHLPDLRARFIQEEIKKPPYNMEARIIEGSVSRNYYYPSDRNVVFLLYIT